MVPGGLDTFGVGKGTQEKASVCELLKRKENLPVGKCKISQNRVLFPLSFFI